MKLAIRSLFIGLIFLCSSGGRLSAQLWTNTSLAAEQRADLLLAAMNLDDKVAMVHAVRLGSGPYYTGDYTNNVRLGIPAVHLQDGPAGVGGGAVNVTAFPAPLTIGASWDVDLARTYGALIAQEHKGKGVHVMLGPMMNMSRVPQDGRNFEGFGEDPRLSGAMAAAEVSGIQGQGVIATIKHFVGNDQETDRGQASSDIDERTLQELYYEPFRACVRAGAGSVMSSYNRLHLRFAGESEQLNATLKKRWGFDGFVMTDWFAAFSTQGGANNGLDVEMYSSGWFGSTLLTPAIQSGAVPLADLDGMVHRILSTMFRFGVFDAPLTGNLSSIVTNVVHSQFTRDAAAQGIVLLKNAGAVLPVGPSIHSIAVIGSAASKSPISGGGGSAGVVLPYNITPLAGLTSRAGTVTVKYSQGDGSSLTQAAQLAASSDLAIVCVGQQTSEGSDRASLSLPNNQDALISAVAAANPHTIVVLNVSGATLMPWASQVSGILVAWYPGQENGNALASVLFGDVTPSGKLPVTFPVSANQVPANTAAQFPGIKGHTIYSEGLQIGSRWYDANNVAPLYCFGYGLSYTTFGYSNLTVSAVSPAGQVQVGCDLTNTGSRPGAEVAQLYLGFPSSANEPPKLLKGFQKISLAAGQSRHVIFNLDWEDLANWDATARGWIVTPGTFQVMLGASSRNIRLTGAFTVASVPSSDLVNAALHKPVTVSSSLSTTTPGAAAVDGDTKSAWCSQSGNSQWLTADLGLNRDLSRVRLQWNTNYASSFSIQISSDATNWSNVYSTNNDSGGLEDLLISGRGRYLRINGFQPGVSGAGYSLSELEVYSQAQRPFGGSVPRLPCLIQAENYDLGGENVAYSDTTVGNQGKSYRSDDVGIEPTTDVGGGYNVAYINTGEWLEYTVNLPDQDSHCNINLRVASPQNGGLLRVRLDGAVLGTLSIPNTGDWQKWQTLWLPKIPLDGGTGSRALRLEVLKGGFNLNWIALDYAGFCDTKNIALNRPVSGSSLQSAEFPATNAVDGDPRTRWASQSSDPQMITVDLGTNCHVGRVRLNWEAAFAKSYQVQLSADNLTWSDVYVTTNNYGILNDLAIDGYGRYVRVFASQRGTGFGDSLWDFEVYPALKPFFSVQPASQFTASGNTVTLNAFVDSDQPMTYQWYHGSSPVPGATSPNLVLVNMGASDAGSYWVTASSALASLSSSLAQVTLYTAAKGIVAQDSATNYSSFTGNQGYGFGPWMFSVTGNTGGGAILNGTPSAFNLWNFTPNASSTATRTFNAPLPVGGTFSVQLKNQNLDLVSNCNGLNLQDASGNVLVSLYWQGNVQADGQFKDAGGSGAATGFTYNANNFSTYAFTLNSATTYTFTDKTTGAKYSGRLSGAPITQVTFFRANNGSGSMGNGQDFKFDNLSIAVLPVPTPLRLTEMPQGWSMSFAVAPGYNYRIQGATNVTGPWYDVGTLTGPVSGWSMFIDTNSPENQSFYRTTTP